jgi:hypothetical protein
MKIGRETEVLGENLPQRHFCPPQIPHDQTRARTRAVAVGSQRLTACAMARALALSVNINRRCTQTAKSGHT